MQFDNSNSSMSGEMALHHVGPNIRRLRNLFDIKQEDLAKQLGISRQTLHTYESGKTTVPESCMETVGNIFNVEIILLLQPNIGNLIRKNG
jgi:DNA-binding XRE family transcriptional regulator